MEHVDEEKEKNRCKTVCGCCIPYGGLSDGVYKRTAGAGACIPAGRN